MVSSDEQLVLEYEQAHKNFFDAIFVSVTIVVSVAAMPLGLLVPFGPLQMRTLFCAVFFGLSFLLFRYFREMYSRWARMDGARTRIALRRRSQQQTVIQQEPVYQ